MKVFDFLVVEAPHHMPWFNLHKIRLLYLTPVLLEFTPVAKSGNQVGNEADPEPCRDYCKVSLVQYPSVEWR